MSSLWFSYSSFQSHLKFISLLLCTVNIYWTVCSLRSIWTIDSGFLIIPKGSRDYSELNSKNLWTFFPLLLSSCSFVHMTMNQDDNGFSLGQLPAVNLQNYLECGSIWIGFFLGQVWRETFKLPSYLFFIFYWMWIH